MGFFLPFMELITIEKNSPNALYISWLIGAEDAFAVTGLNCDPGIFRENLILDLFCRGYAVF